MAEPALSDFERFAHPFATALPYRLYAEGRWLMSRGKAVRGHRLMARALRQLPAGVDRSSFEGWFGAVAGS